MNRHKSAPDQDTATKNSVSVDSPVDKPPVHSQINVPKSTRPAKKNDSEFESVANRSIN